MGSEMFQIQSHIQTRVFAPGHHRDVVIHAAFYVPGNNLKDLERHIDGMCVGTTNEPDEEDENDYIDPDQDSDSDSE
jgi:hypothetical protein